MLTPQVPTSGQPFSSERRSNRRQSVIGRDIIGVSIGAGQTSGLLVDVSEAGMGVQAFAPLKCGSEHRLQWKFGAENRWIIVTGEVAWSNASDYAGLRFLNLPDDDRVQIHRYLRTSGRGKGLPDDTSSPMGEAELTAQLYALVERTLIVTCARGAAIAIASGDRFVCRASKGIAPGLGATVDMEQGLSAECLRTGEMACSDDCENDPRIDADLCRQLGLRSALVVPIKSADGVMGVIVCLWSQPIAYNEHDIRHLTATADRVARLLCPQPQDQI
jgi:GAF domain-containing protein